MLKNLYLITFFNKRAVKIAQLRTMDIYCSIVGRAVDPDPHSFYLLEPDQHIECGSGSRRENFSNKKQKKFKEIAKNCKFIKFFKVNLPKAPLFLAFEQSFMCFTTIKKLFMHFFLQTLLSWIRIRIF